MSAQTTQQVERSVLRAADSGEHTCTATDELGNTGSGSILITVEGWWQLMQSQTKTIVSLKITKMHCIVCLLQVWAFIFPEQAL